MPAWIRYPLYLGGGLFSGWLLWTIGWYVLAFVLVAVLVGLLAFLRWLGRALEMGRITGLVSLGIALWFAVSWVGPAVFVRLDRSQPETSRALGLRQRYADYRTGADITPAAPEAIIASIEHCRKKETIDGERLRQDLAELSGRYQRGEFRESDAVREAELLTRSRDIARFRRLCLEQIVKAEAEAKPKVQPPLAPPPANSGLPGLARIHQRFTGNPRLAVFAAVLLLLAVMAVILIIRIIDRKSVGGVVLGMALLFFAWLAVDQLIFADSAAAAKERIGRPSERALAREYIRVEVKLREPPEWTSIRHYVIPCVPITFDTSAVKDPWIRFADGGEERLGLGKEFGWRMPVELKGEGEAVLWLEEKNRNCQRP